MLIATPVLWLIRKHPPKAADRPATLEDPSLQKNSVFRRRYMLAEIQDAHVLKVYLVHGSIGRSPGQGWT